MSSRRSKISEAILTDCFVIFCSRFGKENFLVDCLRFILQWMSFSNSLNNFSFFSRIQKTLKSLSHFFLHCHYFTSINSTAFSELPSFDTNIVKFSDNEIVDLLLYGSPKFDTDQNHKILNSCISFILKSQRFDGSLLLQQMELVDNKTSELNSCLICQSFRMYSYEVFFRIAWLKYF